MKFALAIFYYFLFSISVISGQTSTYSGDFAKIDKHCRQIPISVDNSVAAITDYLIQPATNDYEKIRGIYTWLITNIEYDTAALASEYYRINQSNLDILLRKKAICFGYAKLLKAMCQQAKINCKVVIGYGQNKDIYPKDLTEINHAWNAVQLNGKWFLIDVTWAAGYRQQNENIPLSESNSYFLDNPISFIMEHLPANQIWQLLPCPISATVFQKGQSQIEDGLKKNSNCIHFEDSIRLFEQLSWHKQRVKTMEFAYQDNPVENNKIELTQTYMDYEGELSKIAETLENTDFLDSLFELQNEMICVCNKVSQMNKLYDSQAENCAYTYLNQGVTISKRTDVKKAELELMLYYFQTAKGLLTSLDDSIFINDGIHRCDAYIDFTKSALADFSE